MCMRIFWPRSGMHAYQMAWHMASWSQLHAAMPEVASGAVCYSRACLADAAAHMDACPRSHS